MTQLIGRHPFVTLKVRLPKDTWRDIRCMIDTGFSGGIALPLTYEEYFPSSTFIEARYVLANGTEVSVNTTYTTIEYQGKRKEVAVVFMSQSDSLVGVEFLDKMKFCLDLKKNKVELTF